MTTQYRLNFTLISNTIIDFDNLNDVGRHLVDNYHGDTQYKDCEGEKQPLHSLGDLQIFLIQLRRDQVGFLYWVNPTTKETTEIVIRKR